MRLPSLPDHELSKNIYLEKICSAVQYITTSQTDLTALIYMTNFDKQTQDTARRTVLGLTFVTVHASSLLKPSGIHAHRFF
jgi:hypothetical protein